MKRRCYFFNTFFYKKLTEKQSKEAGDKEKGRDKDITKDYCNFGDLNVEDSASERWAQGSGLCMGVKCEGREKHEKNVKALASTMRAAWRYLGTCLALEPGALDFNRSLLCSAVLLTLYLSRPALIAAMCSSTLLYAVCAARRRSATTSECGSGPRCGDGMKGSGPPAGTWSTAAGKQQGDG